MPYIQALCVTRDRRRLAYIYLYFICVGGNWVLPRAFRVLHARSWAVLYAEQIREYGDPRYVTEA